MGTLHSECFPIRRCCSSSTSNGDGGGGICGSGVPAHLETVELTHEFSLVRHQLVSTLRFPFSVASFAIMSV